MAYFPTPEQVAVAWIKTVPGVPITSVATSLPGDTASWAADGFVQVTSVAGFPAVHTPLYSPVMQVDCWAVNPNSQKPPWGKAGSLAGAIVFATYSSQNVVLPMLDGYHDARLMSVIPLSEPRRISDDDASFARYQLDLQLNWTLALAVAA